MLSVFKSACTIPHRDKKSNAYNNIFANKLGYTVTLPSSYTQHPYREPAEKVCDHYGDQSSGDGQVLALATPGLRGQGVRCDGPVDDRLSIRDRHEQREVEREHDRHGVAFASELLPGDGQGDTDARVSVESPVREEREEGQGG